MKANNEITYVNKEIIEQYIRKNIIKIIKKRNIYSFQIIPIDSEKKRTFLIEVDGHRIFMKLNIPFWDEENAKLKMVNEKLALELLKERNIENVPILYRYDSNSNILNTEVLLMSYMSDTKIPLNRNNIPKLVKIVKCIHSIKSNTFTVPYGNFSNRFKGNGYDFINSYLIVLKKDIYEIGCFPPLKRLCLEINLRDLISLIDKIIKHNKDTFKKTKEFSMIHGHLARNRERSHVLVEKDNSINIIDWENVCFGERELELASFIYENNTLNFKLKKLFLDLYSEKQYIIHKYIYIYIYLLRLDDLIESLKQNIFLFRAKMPLNINKKFISYIYKQKQLLINLLER